MQSNKFPYCIYYDITKGIVYVDAVLDVRRSSVSIAARERKEQARRTFFP